MNVVFGNNWDETVIRNIGMSKKTHISTYKIDIKLSFDGNYIWHTSSRHVARESIIKSPDETWD